MVNYLVNLTLPAEGIVCKPDVRPFDVAPATIAGGALKIAPPGLPRWPDGEGGVSQCRRGPRCISTKKTNAGRYRSDEAISNAFVSGGQTSSEQARGQTAAKCAERERRPPPAAVPECVARQGGTGGGMTSHGLVPVFSTSVMRRPASLMGSGGCEDRRGNWRTG